MRGPARRGNHNLDAARVRLTRVLHGIGGRAVRRKHAALVVNPEFLEQLGRLAHGLPVRLATHDHRNQWHSGIPTIIRTLPSPQPVAPAVLPPVPLLARSNVLPLALFTAPTDNPP